MKKIKAIAISLILLQNSVARANTPSSSTFVIRTASSSSADFTKALHSSNMISYIEWLQLQQSHGNETSTRLDEALELIAQDPLAAFEKMNQETQELQKNILNQSSLELIVSILIKMSELSVPQRLQASAKDRALELISSHSSMLEISNFKNFAQANSAASIHLPKKQKPDILDTKYVVIFKSKKNKISGLEESLLLMDGEIQALESFTPPKGDHQWVLLSNSFSPVIYIGKWAQASINLITNESLKPLAEGACKKTKIISDSFEVQTQGRVFSSASCFEIAKRSSAAGVFNTNIEPNSFIKDDDSHSRDAWFAAGLIVVLGGALALKDKNISFRMPVFH